MTVKDILQLDWFNPLNIDVLEISKLNTEEIITLLKGLNKIMEDSTDNWEGG